MPSIKLPSECLNIPSLSENATDKEVEEAWSFLNRLKGILLEEKGKEVQKARLLFQQGESKKWDMFRKKLGHIDHLDLTEETGEEKSREIAKKLSAIKAGLSSKQHHLTKLGLWP